MGGGMYATVIARLWGASRSRSTAVAWMSVGAKRRRAAPLGARTSRLNTLGKLEESVTQRSPSFRRARYPRRTCDCTPSPEYDGQIKDLTNLRMAEAQIR